VDIDDRIQADIEERRRRRREEKRRRIKRRRIVALVVVAVLLGLVTLTGFVLVGGESGGASFADATVTTTTTTTNPKPKPANLHPVKVPKEIRGVHVTMALASVKGKLAEYYALRKQGLNTIELDIKDENGEVGFVPSAVPLAKATGAARPYYKPRIVAQQAHRRHLYLVGRVVMFEDPILSEKRPQFAIRTADGSIWRNSAGLGWTNPYDRRVWDYNVSLGVAAAKAGFDEIQFDYVRFPSDGDISIIRYPGEHAQPMGWTIPAFVQYARKRLKPLGVRVSVDMFGLAATHDLGIGQFPSRISRYVDAIYPMVYPSHYNPGEYNLDDPNAVPGAIVGRSLADYNKAIQGRKAELVPWLQDFTLGRTYTLADVQDQIAAARAANARGFMLWNAAGVYTDGALAAPPTAPASSPAATTTASG
jgi:hypothetical protein